MLNRAAPTWRPYSCRTYLIVVCSYCGRGTRDPGRSGYRYRLHRAPREQHHRTTERACPPCWKVWG